MPNQKEIKSVNSEYVPTSVALKIADISGNALPWYREVGPAAWAALLLAGLGWMFESYDSFMLSLTLPTLATVFDLSKTQVGALISVTAAGQICGGILFGWVSDRLGRVRTAYLCILIYSAFSGLIAFAPSISVIAALRFCGALGMGGTWTAGAALVAETWGAKHRGRGGALMQMGLPIGAIVAIGAAAVVGNLAGGLGGNGWRILYMIGALPAVIMFFIARRTPESPVWKKRSQAPLSKARRRFSMPSPAELKGIKHAFFFIFFLQYIFWGVFTWAPTFLIASKHLNFLHSLNFLIALQLGAIAGFVVFGSFVDRFGRRPLFFAYLGIGICSVCCYVLSVQPGILLVALFFTGFSVNGIFAGLGPFTAELIPDTESRAFLMGLAYNGGRIGGLLAPSIIGVLATHGGAELGMSTTIAAFVFAAVVIFFAPETKGRQLK